MIVSTPTSDAYQAVLVVSFGGPEGRDEVLPFLENVLRGRNVPRERLMAVAEHYYHFGGVSPINAQNRALIAALQTELQQHGPNLPIYFGNRNWQPFLADALRRMRDDGIRKALAFFTSAFSSYSGCRQYRENVAAAQAEVGPGAPQVDKLRAFFNHPGYLEPVIENTVAALAKITAEGNRRNAAHLIFTAHSIPQAMAAGCKYELQLRDACWRGGRRCWAGTMAARLPKPQWTTVATVAGARCKRYATPISRGRSARRGCRADRFHFRSYRSAL